MTDVKQQLPVGLLLGHLVVGAKALRCAPGRARIRQVTKRPIEFKQAFGTETSGKAFTWQAQAIADGHDPHATEGLAQGGRPIETGQRQLTQNRRQVAGIANTGTLSRTRQPGCGERCRCNGQHSAKAESLEPFGDVLPQCPKPAKKSQTARNLEQQYVMAGNRYERRKPFGPGRKLFEGLLLARQTAFLELQDR